MNNSVVRGADLSPLAALLLGSHAESMRLLAPCHRGGSTPIVDRVIHSRALSHRGRLPESRRHSKAQALTLALHLKVQKEEILTEDLVGEVGSSESEKNLAAKSLEAHLVIRADNVIAEIAAERTPLEKSGLRSGIYRRRPVNRDRDAQMHCVWRLVDGQAARQCERNPRRSRRRRRGRLAYRPRGRASVRTNAPSHGHNPCTAV
jgi:hypothetical protein